jgi:DNA primase
MVKEFRIGFAPDSGFLLRDALRREFDEETLREGGLFSWKDSQPSAASAEGRGPSTHVSSLRSGALAQDDNAEGGSSGSARDDRGHKAGTRADAAAMYSKFRNRVMFPITNEQGKVIAFTGRTLATDEKAGPKYLNSPETKIYSKSRVLFNLDHAKEAIRKLEYSILVEGQMDCISVYAAGFHNVIASSGTAFTELQAKLLGRFSKNIIVNFDPDTAGARATERTLGLLVEEEFNIRVLTLETGFDPDLFIRRKGREAYGAALKHSQKYFDYLIERARAQFGARSGEAKAKAVNWLLPHVQRVPSRIVRDELAMEISQKLGIDSGVLRQELKHAATTRETVAVKAPAEAQVTPAERVLIRALASAREMQAGEGRSSAREGTDEEFDPARQAQFALTAERLHEGLAAESLIAALLDAGEFGGDPLELARSDEDRRLLASVLMHDDEELTPHTVEGAVRALRRITLRKRLDEVQRRMVAPGVAMQEKQALLQERVRLKRSLMDPGLEEAS